jgi:hypothetical protein
VQTAKNKVKCSKCDTAFAYGWIADFSDPKKAIVLIKRLAVNNAWAQAAA